MKKKYLDFIYDIRGGVISDIERLESLQNQPTQQCCDKMEYKNEYTAELRTRRSELAAIDDLISAYISIHSSKE